MLAVAAGGLVTLLIQVLVAGLVFWLVWWLISYLNPPEPFNKVLRAIVAIVAVLYLINLLLGLTGHGMF